MIRALNRIGEYFLYFLDQAGLMSLLLYKAFVAVLKPAYQLQPIIKQIHFIGAKSIFVIVFAGVFTGMVLALQFYNTLERFGSVDLLGSAVALALLRELGPVMAGLMVVGRAGSAICAEIGIMRTSEQIDALECMAINPVKFLIVPKLIAGIIALPLLTCIFDVVGILGGYMVGVIIFDLSSATYFNSIYTGAEWSDIEMGLYKALLFGLILTWISCAKGYFLHFEREGAFGAEGVSRVTTNAVVTSSIIILFGDYIIGALML